MRSSLVYILMVAGASQNTAGEETQRLDFSKGKNIERICKKRSHYRDIYGSDQVRGDLGRIGPSYIVYATNHAQYYNFVIKL